MRYGVFYGNMIFLDKQCYTLSV